MIVLQAVLFLNDSACLDDMVLFPSFFCDQWAIFSYTLHPSSIPFYGENKSVGEREGTGVSPVSPSPRSPPQAARNRLSPRLWGRSQTLAKGCVISLLSSLLLLLVMFSQG